MYTKLGQQEAEELRADINRVLRSSRCPKPNLNKSDAQAFRELKSDRDRLGLTADKGVAMLIMDRQDYVNKPNKLLSQPAYRAIPRDPTNKTKTKLVSILKRVKNQTGLDNNTYKAMYPMGCGANFHGLPKIHKLDTSFRPMVSSCGSVTYGVPKDLTKILKTLVGKSPHHINSTKDFVEQVKNVTLLPGE